MRWQNPAMSRRSWLSRFALWAAVGALLLKAAVPLLAAGAAQMRGVPVAEVCTVYGVALPAASHKPHAHHAQHHAEHSGHEDRGSHSDESHSGDHCALTALAALALPDIATTTVAQAATAVADRPPAPWTALHDACALWVARLKHGPPALT